MPLREASQCPGPHWIARSGTSFCYLFSTATNNARATYADALKDCQARGGSLTNLENWDEFVRESTFIRKSSCNCIYISLLTYW